MASKYIPLSLRFLSATEIFFECIKFLKQIFTFKYGTSDIFGNFFDVLLLIEVGDWVKY